MTPFTISVHGSGAATLTALPTECPLCHKGIAALPRWACPSPTESRRFSPYGAWSNDPHLQVVLTCPSCGFVFFQLFRNTATNAYEPIGRSVPRLLQKRQFSEEIVATSSVFVTIFNQAAEADALDLGEVAGMGYRKALEFLIKDFLISQANDASQVEDIKMLFLGPCINK